MSDHATISLLHATRGRPDQALAARNKWFAAASHPERIEHVFAIDGDDDVVIKALAGYNHCIVPELGGGCVAAWNLAAKKSTGSILVQLSDDWSPIPGWDDEIARRLRSPSQPAVLRISDGHRTDDLLCMAIFTRPWLEHLGDFLHPGYFSVFSDDEFSFVSYEKGVVVDARDLIFEHHHPSFDSTVSVDETYAQQNHSRHYLKGREVFLSRYPDAMGRWLHEGTDRRQFLPIGQKTLLPRMSVTGIAPENSMSPEKWDALLKVARAGVAHLSARKAHAQVFKATASSASELVNAAKKSLRGRFFWKAAHQAQSDAVAASFACAETALAEGKISAAVDGWLDSTRGSIALLDTFGGSGFWKGRGLAALKGELKAQEKWWQEVTAFIGKIPDDLAPVLSSRSELGNNPGRAA